MLTFTTKTGFGYIKEDATGNVVAKCNLPVSRQLPDILKKLPDIVDEAGNITPGKVVTIPGETIPIEHLIKDGYTFVEVMDEAELNAVQTYQPPLPPDTPEQARRKKIDAELEAMAIERLTARGEL